MTCEDYELIISKYLDDALDDEERANLLLHLSHCDSCQTLLARYRRLDQQIQAMPSVQASPYCRRELFRQAETPSRHFTWQGLLKPLAAASMPLIALVAVALAPGFTEAWLAKSPEHTLTHVPAPFTTQANFDAMAAAQEATYSPSIHAPETMPATLSDRARAYNQATQAVYLEAMSATKRIQASQQDYPLTSTAGNEFLLGGIADDSDASEIIGVIIVRGQTWRFKRLIAPQAQEFPPEAQGNEKIRLIHTNGLGERDTENRILSVNELVQRGPWQP